MSISITNRKETLLGKLKAYSEPYRSRKEEFRLRNNYLKGQFKLKPGQHKDVDFGIMIPADRSLQKYCDILNSDMVLNDLQAKIKAIILDGCVRIFEELKAHEIYIPGYDLDEFIKDPEENDQEILNLMQGFGGYKHIITIRDKITLEIPAKKFLTKDRHLKHAIKYWLKTVKEFSLYN